jgi:hypothetical protein
MTSAMRMKQSRRARRFSREKRERHMPCLFKIRIVINSPRLTGAEPSDHGASAHTGAFIPYLFGLCK